MNAIDEALRRFLRDPVGLPGLSPESYCRFVANLPSVSRHSVHHRRPGRIFDVAAQSSFFTLLTEFVTASAALSENAARESAAKKLEEAAKLLKPLIHELSRDDPAILRHLVWGITTSQTREPIGGRLAQMVKSAQKAILTADGSLNPSDDLTAWILASGAPLNSVTFFFAGAGSQACIVEIQLEAYAWPGQFPLPSRMMLHPASIERNHCDPNFKSATEDALKSACLSAGTTHETPIVLWRVVSMWGPDRDVRPEDINLTGRSAAGAFARAIAHLLTFGSSVCDPQLMVISKLQAAADTSLRTAPVDPDGLKQKLAAILRWNRATRDPCGSPDEGHERAHPFTTVAVCPSQLEQARNTLQMMAHDRSFASDSADIPDLIPIPN